MVYNHLLMHLVQWRPKHTKHQAVFDFGQAYSICVVYLIIHLV